MKSRLLNISLLLRELSHNLKRTANGAYEYIDLLAGVLATSDDKEAVEDALRQVKSSAKMVELANFDNAQEQIWRKAWDEATRLLAEEQSEPKHGK